MVTRAGTPITFAVALTAIALGLSRPGLAQRTPVFRASADLVSVHVSVNRRGSTLPDLEIADFVVRDNDVMQTVSAVSREKLPVDVTLFLDTSGSLSHWRDGLERDVNTIMAMLGPEDRLRLLTFGYEVEDVFGWRSPEREMSFRMPAVGRISAVYDAILLALIRRPEPDRRHLVVALTDGDDWSSVGSSSALLDAAGRTDAVLHIVRLASASSLSARPSQWSASRPDYEGPQRLEQTAARTGGRLHPTPAAGRAVVEAFRGAFEDFRSGYMLRYVYEGPAPGGWHDIKVELSKPGNHVVRARGGYFGSPPQDAGQTRTLISAPE